MEKSKAYKSGIGLRLLAILLAGIVLAYGLLTYMLYGHEKALVYSLEKDRAEHLAGDLSKHIRELMLEKKLCSEIKNTLAAHKVIENANIGVFKNDGSVYYGENMRPFPGGLVGSLKPVLLRTPGSLVLYKPVISEPHCNECHGASAVRAYVAVEVFTSRTKTGIHDVFAKMALFTIFTAFMSIIGVVAVTRRMFINPLDKLSEGVRAVSSGRFRHRIDLRRKDEFGSLAAAFNEMAGKIENSQNHLTEEVQRRTAENLELIQGQRRDIEELIRLYDLSSSMLHSQDPAELAQTVAAASTSFNDVTAAAVWLKEKHGLVLKASYGLEHLLLPHSLTGTGEHKTALNTGTLLKLKTRRKFSGRR